MAKESAKSKAAPVTGKAKRGKSPAGSPPAAFRPPAVPLIAIDPYFSVWSGADRLTDNFPQHWTGRNHSMTGLLRIDGSCYRFIGPQPETVRPMKQISVNVWPTRSIYQFKAAGVSLEVTFTTPALPGNLDVFSWPVTYVAFAVESVDGRAHQVELYFDLCAEFVVNECGQEVTWSRKKMLGAGVLSFGAAAQDVLGVAGDDRRIDWGYVYLVIPDGEAFQDSINPKQDVQSEFADTGKLIEEDDLTMPRAVSDGWPALMAMFPIALAPGQAVHRHVMLAYDDLYSIEYFQRKLRPYWNRNNIGLSTLLRAALNDYETLREKCRAFDAELMADMTRCGGAEYATMCALAYRQTVAAHKLVADIDGAPLYFSKENYSNGCIATVDVTYPSAPFFLLFCPQLLKAQLVPIFDYACLPRWRFPFAPHDLGTYPLANGQVYGGGERSEKSQMPVEECGNMLLLTAALVKAEGHVESINKYWPLLSKWANFLKEKGFDPEKQLCTDDFAGRLAHNTNLSIKAILALGAFGWLCTETGRNEEGREFRKLAQDMAARWTKVADNKTHYRLAFDRAGTWSQKYNLVWDQLLDLNLFGPKVRKKEVAFYLKNQDRFGLPLDSRKRYTKLDWIYWTACLADSETEFRAFIKPTFDWANKTNARVALTDWYWTNNGRQVFWARHGAGFQARSVVGGMFIKMLFDAEIWSKWRQDRRFEHRHHHARPPAPKV